VQRECERARQWASAEIDGELSSFERALLEAHLAGCLSCSEFHTGIGGLAGALRAAPRERFEGVVATGRIRRRARMRLAPAAAAMAVAAVGLGSILASADLRHGSVGSAPSHALGVSSAAAANAVNLRTLRVQETLEAKAVRAESTSRRWLRGGPVVLER
jgi:predicted anti-sigma-YlaC factor YlaD